MAPTARRTCSGSGSVAAAGRGGVTRPAQQAGQTAAHAGLLQGESAALHVEAACCMEAKSGKRPLTLGPLGVEPAVGGRARGAALVKVVKSRGVVLKALINLGLGGAFAL